MELQTTTHKVSHYDFTLYNQAIAKAKAQYRKDHNDAQFKMTCMSAYTHMMQSPDTEIVEVKTNRPQLPRVRNDSTCTREMWSAPLPEKSQVSH